MEELEESIDRLLCERTKLLARFKGEEGRAIAERSREKGAIREAQGLQVRWLGGVRSRMQGMRGLSGLEYAGYQPG